VINYLKASSIEVGLLLNFGDTPQFQRFKFDNARKAARKPPEELGPVDPNSRLNGSEQAVDARDGEAIQARDSS